MATSVYAAPSVSRRPGEARSFFEKLHSLIDRELQEHLAYITSDQKRNNEVSISRLSEADKKEFENAKTKKLING